MGNCLMVLLTMLCQNHTEGRNWYHRSTDVKVPGCVVNKEKK